MICFALFIGCSKDTKSSYRKEYPAKSYTSKSNQENPTTIDTSTSQIAKFKIGDIVSIPVRKNVGLYGDLPVYIKDKLLNDGSYEISDSNWCSLWFTQAQKFKIIDVVNIIKKQNDESIIKYLMKMNKDYGQLFWYRIQATDPVIGDKCIEGFIEEERLSLIKTN